MTDEPVISDAEVEAFHKHFAGHGFDARSALAAFLSARVPEPRKPDDGNGDDDDQNRGFNACRDLVWNGPKPTAFGMKVVVDPTMPPDQIKLVKGTET